MIEGREHGRFLKPHAQMIVEEDENEMSIGDSRSKMQIRKSVMDD